MTTATDETDRLSYEATRPTDPATEDALLRTFTSTRAPDDFEPLMRHSLKRVSGLIYKVVLCPHTTDDLVQETYIKAYQQFDRFQGRSSFSTWVCRIGINMAISHLRKERHRRQGELIDDALPGNPSLHPDSRAMVGEKYQQVDAAMRRLSPPLRAALVMSVIDEMPIPDVAKALGCPRATVYWRIHQARKQLRAFLENPEVPNA